jgi:hypothetical protein
MGRVMGGDDEKAYRAVVVETCPAEPESDYEPHRVERKYTYYYGPYRTAGVAKAAVTRETMVSRYWDARGVTKTGWIEEAETVWKRVD